MGVIFDVPVEISMIKIWNYTKTITRGVKDFALLVDDLLVYNGTLGLANPSTDNIFSLQNPNNYHTIVFTKDQVLIEREKDTIIHNLACDQDVQLLNDRKIITTFTN